MQVNLLKNKPLIGSFLVKYHWCKWNSKMKRKHVNPLKNRHCKRMLKNKRLIGIFLVKNNSYRWNSKKKRKHVNQIKNRHCKRMYRKLELESYQKLRNLTNLTTMRKSRSLASLPLFLLTKQFKISKMIPLLTTRSRKTWKNNSFHRYP